MSINNANLPIPCYDSHGFGWEQALAKPSDELFRENLNFLMKKLNKKNVQLARYLDVTESVVGKWRKGLISCEVWRLTPIAEFLEVPVSRLFLDSSDSRTTKIDVDMALEIIKDAIKNPHTGTDSKK